MHVMIWQNLRICFRSRLTKLMFFHDQLSEFTIFFCVRLTKFAICFRDFLTILSIFYHHLIKFAIFSQSFNEILAFFPRNRLMKLMCFHDRFSKFTTFFASDWRYLLFVSLDLFTKFSIFFSAVVWRNLLLFSVTNLRNLRLSFRDQLMNWFREIPQQINNSRNSAKIKQKYSLSRISQAWKRI